MKRLFIVILVIIVVGIGFYLGVREAKKSLPISSSSTTSSSVTTGNAYDNYEKMALMFPGTQVKKENAKLQLPTAPNVLELLNQKRQPTPDDISLLHTLQENYKPALDEFEQGAKQEKCIIPGKPLPKGSLTLSDISTHAMQSTPSFATILSISKLMVLRGKLAELENHPEDAINDYCMVMKAGKQMDQTLLITRLVGTAMRNIGSQAMMDLLAKPSSISVSKTALEKMQELEPAPLLDLNSLKDYEGGLRIQDFTQETLNFAEQAGVTLAFDTAPVTVRYNTAYAKQELAYLSSALRIYQSKNQKLPEKLESLVPDIIHSLPQDPFTQAPFLYTTQGTSFVLYSVGPDMTDDHAQILYDPTNGTMSTGDIVLIGSPNQ